ncbi:MICOS complex subunit MIC27 isoform X2 [Syngnathoides biaculeatus]|uniref:MICOS complex subunit MIC27 isoform X2 n=1 Tax=Syngnathoides biaculeatus TaxID=300417 RepID=UPI002ADD3A5B|nr:MICOS complex subunit MIC27 isoform X2 [Syngnathoides biaculeatus]
MAAKVAMVAVPAVLGIASIRVYTISEVPTEGLITREKLNIYTPVAKSAQVQRVADQPGVIENGLTTAREGLLPFVHVVKEAYVSVKRGSVNLYHAGEDMYYYLKDPPPGFLPRFGTITMAGLLGMFLARKGSRLKRIAVPLGLMSAGASVCYPAQAVAVFKVTSKKMYAAGQWSRAALGSLLTSSSPEHDAAPQPQATHVPPPETAVVDEPRHAPEPDRPQALSISETEAKSVECIPAADKPIIAIASQEPSVARTEIPAEQFPAERDSVQESVDSVQSLMPQASKEAPEGALAASVDAVTSSVAISLASDGTPTDTLPAESTLSSGPGTEESAQIETPPAEVPASTEEPPIPKISNEPAVSLVDSKEPPAAGLGEEGSQKTHKLAEQSAANSKGDSEFRPDPALLDFGQSNPEDEDLYSTR